MTYAVKPAAQAGADWTEVHAHSTVDVGGLTFSAAWLDGLSAEDLAGFHLVRAEIVETEQPTGPSLRIIGSAIDDDAGVPMRRWLTEEVGLEELRAMRLGAAAAEYARRRQLPLAWDFGETEGLDDAEASVGPAGPQTLQMRDDGVQNDLQNWLAAQAAAMAAIGAGAPEMIQPLKTTANIWVQTTAAQVAQVLVTGDGEQVSAFQNGAACLKAFGALKKAIAAAPDIPALVAIDVTAGWPT